MKKIVVTGGAGMIGSNLVRVLIASNYEVIVIDNLWRGKLSFLEEIRGFDIERSFFNLDLSRTENRSKIIDIISGYEVVIHLADIVAGIGYVFENQYEIFKINNEINSITFSACEAAGISRVIYAGTACSFPKDLQLSLTSVLKEDLLFPAEPESAYGWSKLMGSLELSYLAEKTGINFTTLILHNVYGRNCDIDPKRSQVIPSLIRRVNELKEGEDLVVWGSGNQGRAFLHVDDVVNGFIAALERENLPPVIQLGPNYCTSIRELATILINKTFQKKVGMVFDTTKPEGDIGRCADFSLAQEVLDWVPRITIELGLKDTADWVVASMAKRQVS
jgi:GDP-D-mannose 3',5'-epimerase